MTPTARTLRAVRGRSADLGRAGARRWRERPSAQRRALGTGMPEVLEQVARSLRTGASLPQAVAEAAEAPGPAAASLGQVAAVHRRGVPLADACHGWARAVPLPEVQVAATALALAATGGAAARAVDGAAASLRARLAVASSVRAATAQARLSAVVLTGLAPVFTAWSAVTDPAVRAFLVGGPAGWTCLAAGAVLDAAGALWIARIVRSVR